VSDPKAPLIISNRELTPEEEYFAREEALKLKKLREEAAAKMAEGEKTRLRDLHQMRCPKCGMELHEVDFQGVRIDRCFACGGSFFDAGEVEKLLEHQHGRGVIGRLKTIFG
jgi:uncharacterized protein